MKRKRPTYTGLVLGMVLVMAFIFVPMLTHSQGPGIEDIEQAVANARTKADHERLAAHYEGEAKHLGKKSEEHQKLAKAYEKVTGVYPKRSYMAQHCKALARRYKEAAEDNRALAKLHHELAAEVEQED
ncbi:conserved hypothetical protein [Nitrosococcus halophilus Nc 4]|uniref:Uncharacterized protein n=1 Tax=Nitrosococcus halophilus (strain Nc4) TaxID=472759 RepID=D5C2G7_NITHN|nr:hypothetical protein [Nitrosococcus halophilus]ADE14826.1 conserved hypothetical protein [Nitrosococcus halophilus Nc 4]